MLPETKIQVIVVAEELAAGALSEAGHGGIHAVQSVAEGFHLENYAGCGQFVHLHGFIDRWARRLRVQALGIQGVDHHSGANGLINDGVLFSIERAREESGGGEEQHALARRIAKLLEAVLDRSERRPGNQARLLPSRFRLRSNRIDEGAECTPAHGG